MASKILIVDDQPINIQLLERKLAREGLGTLSALSGQEALDIVAKEKPDLILLDIMMPGMDGFEVCQHLQANPETRTIPVIFVTARGAREHRLEGLSAGAVDYLTKPIDLDEMVARVRTQLRLVSINREVIDLQNRLFEARRSATIGAVTQGIAHNLNNLLAVVLGYVDLIKIQYNKPENVKANAANAEKAVKRIAAIIKQLNLLVVQSRPVTSIHPLQKLLEGGVARYQGEFGITAPVQIENALGSLGVEVRMESFEDILAKLLINAWESYGSEAPAEKRLINIHTQMITTPHGTQAVEIRINDRGSGISSEIRDHIFEPFVSTKQNVGVGMGLSITRHALRSLGGELTLIDRDGGGTSAVILMPLRQEPRRE